MLFYCHQRIRIFKRGAARACRQSSRPQWLVIAPIEIDLPSLESTAGIDDLPSCAAKDGANRVVERGQLGAVPKTILAFSGRGRCARDKDIRAAPARMRREAIPTPAVVANVTQTIDRRRDPSEPLFLHRGQKFARIASPVQTARRDWCDIETALRGETRFHRRVIKRADDEVSSGVTLRPAGKCLVLAREPDLRLRPWNIREQRCGQSQQNDRAAREKFQSPKKSATGPPSKTSMGKRSYSYS